ncbi:MAG: hypothetical protein KJ667_02190 [Alphaproteobacteria bacterium]|nr:hypothetical protein [Alphaproteobacteria bacterium]
MSLVAGIVTRYVTLYALLDRMLAGEHSNAQLRRQFAQEGKAFLDDHFALAQAPYSNHSQSDFALLRANPELKKQVARVISAFDVNAQVAGMIPGASNHSGNELDKVTELLNSPERLRMLRLIRNPAMAELAQDKNLRALLDQKTCATLDRLNAADARKPSVDELPLAKRLQLVRQAIAAPEANQGFLGGIFRKAASALVPDSVLTRINTMAETAYRSAQTDLESALQARTPSPGGAHPAP